jgi:hypothetical protein
MSYSLSATNVCFSLSLNWSLSFSSDVVNVPDGNSITRASCCDSEGTEVNGESRLVVGRLTMFPGSVFS